MDVQNSYSTGYAPHLLNNKDSHDVTFVVGNQKFYAHKVFLCRNCKYFQNLLGGSFSGYGDLDLEIEIRDYSPAIFYKVLEYIYSGKLGDLKNQLQTVDNLFSLLFASMFYELESMQRDVELYIAENMLEVNNVTYIWRLAHQYGAHLLAEACSNYFKKNTEQIIARPEFTEEMIPIESELNPFSFPELSPQNEEDFVNFLLVDDNHLIPDSTFDFQSKNFQNSFQPMMASQERKPAYSSPNEFSQTPFKKPKVDSHYYSEPISPHTHPLSPHNPVSPHANPVSPHSNPVSPHPNPVSPHPNPVSPHPSPLSPHPSPVSPQTTPVSPLGPTTRNEPSSFYEKQESSHASSARSNTAHHSSEPNTPPSSVLPSQSDDILQGPAWIRALEKLNLLADMMREICNADIGTIFLHDPFTNELYAHVTHPQPVSIAIPSHLGIAGSVFTSGKIINSSSAYADPRFYSGIDRQTGAPTLAILAVPIFSSGNTPLGVVEILNKKRKTFFSQQNENEVVMFSRMIGKIVENAIQQAKSQPKKKNFQKIHVYNMEESKTGRKKRIKDRNNIPIFHFKTPKSKPKKKEN